MISCVSQNRFFLSKLQSWKTHTQQACMPRRHCHRHSKAGAQHLSDSQRAVCVLTKSNTSHGLNAFEKSLEDILFWEILKRSCCWPSSGRKSLQGAQSRVAQCVLPCRGVSCEHRQPRGGPRRSQRPCRCVSEGPRGSRLVPLFTSWVVSPWLVVRHTSANRLPSGSSHTPLHH